MPDERKLHDKKKAFCIRKQTLKKVSSIFSWFPKTAPLHSEIETLAFIACYCTVL